MIFNNWSQIIIGYLQVNIHWIIFSFLFCFTDDYKKFWRLPRASAQVLLSTPCHSYSLFSCINLLVKSGCVCCSISVHNISMTCQFFFFILSVDYDCIVKICNLLVCASCYLWSMPATEACYGLNHMGISAYRKEYCWNWA